MRGVSGNGDFRTIPRTVLAFPYWTSNPYLNLLYLAARADGWEVAAATELEEFVAAVENDLVEGDIVHVHWTAPVTEHATTESEARQRLATFRRALDVMASRRIQLLWTVHNELAHDTAFHEVEQELAQALADHASTIIQLHEYTAEAVARFYRLPSEKLVTLRHSSYLGVYPDTTEREARERLGIAQHAQTVGFVGRIRPYKGVETLFAAMDHAAPRVDGLTLLLAGRTAPDDLAAIEATLPRNVDVVRHTSFVGDDDLAAWFRASNVVALPYRQVLNSGSLLLAATFGRPCLIPDSPPLARVYRDESWVHTFPTDGDPAANLADLIVKVLPGTEDAERAADAYARSYTPFDMSRDYLRILDDIAAAPRDQPDGGGDDNERPS